VHQEIAEDEEYLVSRFYKRPVKEADHQEIQVAPEYL